MTLPSGLPETVEDGETISRFLTSYNRRFASMDSMSGKAPLHVVEGDTVYRVGTQTLPADVSRLRSPPFTLGLPMMRV